MNPLNGWKVLSGHDEERFEKLSISSLEKITNTANKGQAYVDFFKAVQGCLRPHAAEYADDLLCQLPLPFQPGLRPGSD